MQTKKLMKLVFVVTIIMGIAINACKKNDNATTDPTPTPINTTRDTAYMKVNGTLLISPVYAKSQSATQFYMVNTICGTALDKGISIAINKAGLVEGQTYDKSIIASCSVRVDASGTGYYNNNVSAAQIKLVTYTATYIKITFSMSLVNGGNTATITEGVLELRF
jgi:hypothetical protein